VITPCRLFVILARDVPIAVILRRGPSRWFHVIRWDMQRDVFEHGAWFRGRIYESKCDLSPDGQLLVAFVHQGRRLTTSYTDSWTAVSRAPWLHALTLWPQGTTYGGGGRFMGKRDLTIRHGVSMLAHPDHPATDLSVSFGNVAVHVSTETIEGADWAGRDHTKKVIFAREGKLYRRGTKGDVELADFNGLTPSPVEAPEWAQAPLGRRASKRPKPRKRK
jgi:hypothetical protein